MPLLFCDLDNTLIDRAGAYERWATRYLDEHGHDPRLLAQMVEIDGDGLRPKPDVAEGLRELLSLSEGEHEHIVASLRDGVVHELVPDEEVVDALRSARSEGWIVVIVTNGATYQQERKIMLMGLDEEVDGWVISEQVGVAKPDPAIFTIAAREVDVDDLEGAWMIGDTAAADIAGAANAGISSIWLHRGRTYPDDQPEPTARAASLAEAIEIVLATD